MHFYILTIDSEKEIKETIPFTVTSKRIKYLVIKLSKEAKDLHTEKCKMLIKEIEDGTNRWKAIPCSSIGKISIVKLTILPKAIYRFCAIPIELPMAFFLFLFFFNRTRTKILKFIETQKTPKSQSNLKKKEQSWRNHAHILQIYSHQISMILAEKQKYWSGSKSQK